MAGYWPSLSLVSLFITLGHSLSKYQCLWYSRLWVLLHSEVWSPLANNQNSSTVYLCLWKKIQGGSILYSRAALWGTPLCPPHPFLSPAHPCLTDTLNLPLCSRRLFSSSPLLVFPFLSVYLLLCPLINSVCIMKGRRWQMGQSPSLAGGQEAG